MTSNTTCRRAPVLRPMCSSSRIRDPKTRPSRARYNQVGARIRRRLRKRRPPARPIASATTCEFTLRNSVGPSRIAAVVVTGETGGVPEAAPAVPVAGEIDVHTAGRFRSSVDDGLDQVADTDAVALLIDLTGVTFLGSSGLTALVEAACAAGGSASPYASSSTTTVR